MLRNVLFNVTAELVFIEVHIVADLTIVAIMTSDVRANVFP